MSHESSKGTKLLYCLIYNLGSCVLTPNYFIYRKAIQELSMTTQMCSYLISNIQHDLALEGHYQVSIIIKKNCHKIICDHRIQSKDEIRCHFLV